MKPIHDVKNMPPEAIELFEAAGYIDAKTIFDHSVSEITAELTKANNVLDIFDANPTHENVESWLKSIDPRFKKSIDAVDDSETKNIRQIDTKDIINSRFAIPISAEFINKNQIDLEKLPSGNVRILNKDPASVLKKKYKDLAKDNDELSDQHTIISKKGIKAEENESLGGRPSAKNTTTDNAIPALDMSRIIKTETFKNEGSHVTPIKKAEDVGNIQTASDGLNKDVDPQSKFYIKGVLHKGSSKFKLSCLIFISVHLLITLSLAITSLLIIDKEQYSWAAWALLLGVVAIILYFTAAHTSSCPICGQRQFAAKRCLKHKQAHHWPVVGYMLPTSLHALIYKWFRCIFCGTSVRLKK